MNKKAKLLLVALLALSVWLAPGGARADDPDYLTLSAGWFDANRKKDQGAEFSLEYRSDKKFWWFKPFVHAAGVTNGMTFLGAGVLIDVYFGRRWVVSPSFAPTWWRGKTSDLDLGHALEFRSRLEVAYRFDDRSRLGLSISHSSNASLGGSNPGTESVMVNYSVPFDKVSRLFD
ncbi:MAG: acyloxyacyl hydrolase [Rhodospirillaceae bacterium]